MINTQPTIKVGQVIFFGFHDKAAFDAGGSQLSGSPQSFPCTDPAIFDQYFRRADSINSGLSFTAWIEAFAQNDSGSLFFEFAMVLSPVDPLSLEIGLLDKAKVVVGFEDNIFSPGGNYALGMTIRVNGVSQTISAAVRNLSVLTFTIPAVDSNDVVDWSYNGGVGDLQDDAGALIESFSLLAVTNSVGAYLRFNEPEGSGWLAAL
jgi:hypothetical protein